MSGYELYIFFLCLVVFVLLTVLAVILLGIILKLTIRLIRGGQEDESIKKEYKNAKKKARNGGGIEKIFTLLFGVIFVVIVAFSVFINLQKEVVFDGIPTIKVVLSDSMKKKHEQNAYLTENNLDNQFDKFSVLLVYKMPAEEELKLYDVVLYEYDGVEIIHRIVKIETDEKTGEKLYTFQGDYVKNPDAEKVKYDQMLAIYRGENIPYVGSFISFMQSPAGWLCVLLIIIAFIATPILEKKIEKERHKRFLALRNANQGLNNATYVTPHYCLDIHVVMEEPEFVKRARMAQCCRNQQSTPKKKRR